MKRERKAKDEDAIQEQKPSKRARKPSDQPSHADNATVSSSSRQIGKLPSIGRAEVDELCPERSSWQVVVDADGTQYDASLSLSNIDDNNNKFYYIQLLLKSPDHALWTHWGRVGETGQSKLEPNKAGDEGRMLFQKKFREKTGLAWTNRHGAPKLNKYTLIEKSYGNDQVESDNGLVMGDGPTLKRGLPGCTISDELQDLVRFCFDVGTMVKSMDSQNYNYNKLPLGKLSKSTIEKGYAALKDLGDVILDPNLAKAKYQTSLAATFSDLSSQYYTIIPHDFGRKRPTPINSEAQLKAEMDLVETLGNMQISNSILNKIEHPTASPETSIHPLDAQFSSLGLQDATPLKHDSTEFTHLKQYLYHSKESHSVTSSTTIQHIYRISRPSETSRFKAGGFDPTGMTSKSINDHRRLLWHGSRSCNFGGILSQGLRIAPPEAPANGKSFGKGIYLADRASKSAAYCDPWTSDRTLLLLLCEVQLGNPSYVRTGHEYNAVEQMRKKGLISAKMAEDVANEPLEWMDAGVLSGEVEGVMMPDCAVRLPKARGNPNEYIVYDVAQIKIRYVFMLKWKGSGQWGIY